MDVASRCKKLKAYTCIFLMTNRETSLSCKMLSDFIGLWENHLTVHLICNLSEQFPDRFDALCIRERILNIHLKNIKK